MPNNSASSSQTQAATRGSTIGTLRRKRGHILGQISSLTTFLDYYEDSDSRDPFLLQTHLNGLKETWKKFDDLQFNIEELDESEESRRYEIQNSYYAALARANRFLNNEQQPSPTVCNAISSPRPSSISAPMAIKLPEMRLPTFDGTIENWSSFYDLFASMIDRNEDLTSVQKLQYLRSTLTGKAAACIQTLATTDANYNDAKALLQGKFDCPRRTILAHCEALHDIPKLVKDTPEALGNLVDTINQHLRALMNLGEDVSAWNSLLLSIILSKVNSSTIWHWELTLKDKRTVPPYTDLLTFLDKRASCALISNARASQSKRPEAGHSGNPQTSKDRPSRSHAFTSTETRRRPYDERRPRNGPNAPTTSKWCLICKDIHPLWSCTQFRGLSVQERITALKKTTLCQNCFRDGHNADTCVSSTCRVCHKKHHTLLHQPERVAELATPTGH